MATKEEIIEEVADVVEETLDVIENTERVVKNNPKLIIAIAVLSAGGGAALSYFLSKKKLIAQYEEEYSEKLAESRAYYQRNSKPPTPGDVLGNIDTPVEVISSNQGDAVAQMKSEIKRRNYGAAFADEADQAQRRVEEVTGQNVEIEQPEAEIPAEVVNIFTEPSEVWNYETENAKRTEEAPYVIHRDEYNGNETEYPQTTLTYYDEDGVLTDERDVPIDDVDGTVGDDNTEKFGHGSMDPNVVYIRNDRLELDIELIRANGSYNQLVLGIKHEDEPRRRRPSRLGRDDE